MRLEDDPDAPGAPPVPAPTPISPALAALEAALARWSLEFTSRLGLADPDLAGPEQAALELRVADGIRRLYRDLDAAALADPTALAHARAAAAALISQALHLDPPITIAPTHEELALRVPR
jgi:hypothetical protein